MKIEDIQTIAGPNVFHHKPVLVMTLALEELAECASNELDGFNELLLHYLPGLKEHHCSPGYRGGFVERLQRGTYLAHIVEHVTLELSTLCGIQVNFGKTVHTGREGVYRVAVRYRCESGMRSLLHSAVALVEAVIRDDTTFPLAQHIESTKKLEMQDALGPSTLAVVQAAEKRGIPWTRLNGLNLIQFGYGSARRMIQATTTCRTGDIAVDIAQNKNLTKKMLEGALIRVPRGCVVTDENEALRAFVELGGLVAVKPFDGHQGEGVSLGLATANEVRYAFQVALHFAASVIIEEFLVGRDYRVLVVGGKMVAASERTPALVVGDGIHSLVELVAIENRNPLRGAGHGKALTKIDIDETVEFYLARRNLDLKHVPAPGEKVLLRETANLSTGGTAHDVTEIVHPEIRQMCERASRVIGLDVCGIDLIATDISLLSSPQNAAVIEVNAGPGIRMHHFPSEGASRDVGAAIVNFLYPAGETGRIPIVSITGTNGKTTVARLASHLLEATGKVVGLTSTDGISIGGNFVSRGDTTGPASARALLCDPGVEIAVLETARGGIVRRGLGYDWSDIGVITNIQSDHIGQDGIESVEDIFRIKSLVAERVREGGVVVLNAEDPSCRRLIEKFRFDPFHRRIFLFSTEPDLPILRAHLARGGNAFFLRNGYLFEASNGEETQLLHAAAVPITFLGTARFQIANALAAVAACRALGLKKEEAIARLRSFQPSSHNSGRANIYHVGKGTVMVDYGHNPEAFRAICAMTALWQRHRVTGVITSPGDRSDEMIRETGKAAALGFDRIIIREDEDLRGRRPGEVASLLCSAIQEENPSVPCEVILCPRQAIETALLDLKENNFTVIFYENLGLVQEVLQRFNAQPVADFAAILPELASAAFQEVG